MDFLIKRINIKRDVHKKLGTWISTASSLESGVIFSRLDEKNLFSRIQPKTSHFRHFEVQNEEKFTKIN